VKLQNQQGQFVSMTREQVVLTADQFLSDTAFKRWAPVNLPGRDSWPIVAIVYGQIKQVPEDIPDAKEMVQFLTWSLNNLNLLQTQPELNPIAFKWIEPDLKRMETQKTFDGRAVRSRK
jgi:hypothetical protein